MKWQLFRLYLREMNKQRKRMILTTSGIAWGTLSILLLLAFGQGLKNQLTKTNKGLGKNIVIMYGGQTGKVYQGLPRGRRIHLTEEDVSLMADKIPQISAISGEYDRYGVSLTYGKKTVTKRVTGVSPAFEDMRTHYPQPGSRFINEMDIRQRRRVVFLGNVLKERLFGAEPAVGKVIQINNIPFTVIGVMRKKLQMSMYGGPDAHKATIPISTFRSLFGRRYLNRIIFQVNDPGITPFVKRQAFKLLGRKYRFDAADEKALPMWDTVENTKIMTTMLIGIQLFLGLIGTLTLIIASVGVANIMYVTVKERTREIGIKRALGAKKRQVKQQFIYEALAIAVAGGVIGGAIALVIILALQGIPIEDGSPLQFLGRPTFSWTIALATTGILGIVGLAAGYFPARRAATVDPIEALHYE